jgi:hypothetical protein
VRGWWQCSTLCPTKTGRHSPRVAPKKGGLQGVKSGCGVAQGGLKREHASEPGQRAGGTRWACRMKTCTVRPLRWGAHRVREMQHGRGVAQGGPEDRGGRSMCDPQDGGPAIDGPVTIESNTVRPLRWGVCGVLKREWRSPGRAKRPTRARSTAKEHSTSTGDPPAGSMGPRVSRAWHGHGDRCGFPTLVTHLQLRSCVLRRSIVLCLV